MSFVVLVAGPFTLTNVGMFGVDRFDAILPPRQARGAIMAVGVSNPTLVADKDGYFNVKSLMLVHFLFCKLSDLLGYLGKEAELYMQNKELYWEKEHLSQGMQEFC
ncbi:dihydrolipoyllysine-residue acetyltransferase component 4 of pyruvate dehydrogenase complex, chloroplastic-like [Bidens hawaiensis]|uniref:dihydrolipoyllysine-residue acetyltransferase component 4 of pyruvate dehydrogenase complex, chloroplastic-like n=1 Tax=Bidens hawaiensis TaxID=980011 RepID=UPI0040499C32